MQCAQNKWLATVLASLAVPFALGDLACLSGCVQGTETGIKTESDTRTPSDLGQLQDQFGNSVRESDQRLLVFGPIGHAHFHGSPFILAAPLPEELASALQNAGLEAGGQAQQAEGSDATHTMTNGAITLTVTQSVTAGTEQEAAQTGTVQPGVSLTQTPTTTVTPTQEVKPEFSTAVTISVAWAGSAIDAMAAATGRGSMEGMSQANQKTLRTAISEWAKDGDPSAFIAALESVFGVKATDNGDGTVTVPPMPDG